MLRFLAFSLFGLSLFACRAINPSANQLKEIEVTEAQRQQLFAQAKVFQGIENPSQKTEEEIKNGPFPTGAKPGKNYFAWGEQVTCEFSEKNFTDPPSGMSPKFLCNIRNADGTIVQKNAKVKYDPANPEIYNETAASRLLWLLGFPADHYYSVKVKCLGCPTTVDPWTEVKRVRAGTAADREAALEALRTRLAKSETRELSIAMIEKKWGEEVVREKTDDSGWSFADELSPPNESAFYAKDLSAEERAARHALVILAGMLAHVDNQPGNQRIYCRVVQDEQTCAPGEYWLLIQDLGATMGGFRLNWEARNMVADRAQLEFGMNVWANAASTAVFVDKKGCEVSVPTLAEAQTLGPQKKVRVSEAGREFLLKRFVALGGGQGTEWNAEVEKLLRQQLQRVFLAGRNGELYQNTGWWVNTLMRKLTLLRNHKGCQS